MPEPTNATLAQVLDQLEADTTLPDPRKRDLISAINRISRYLARPPEDITVLPQHLRQLLARLHPAQLGITSRSLANVKSSLQAAMTHTGHLPTSARRPQSRAWTEFLSKATAHHQVLGISRFVNFCCVRRIEPQHVTDGTMALFRDHLDARLLTKDPTALCAEMITTWNCIARQQPIAHARLQQNQRARHKCPSLTTYPQALQDELQTYLDRLSHADLFAEGGPDKPLKPMSLRNISACVRQYLAALSEAGHDPAQFVSLKAVVTAENIKTAAQTIHARSSSKHVRFTIYNIIAVLISIARHHLHLPETELLRIKKLKGQTKPDSTGMTTKNRARLDQFADFQNVIRLIGLPEVLMAAAISNSEMKTAPLRAMYAAAITILLSCPMRIKNLASLDIDKHLQTHGQGAGLRYSVRIADNEVKNHNHIEAQLNAKNSRLLHQYIMQWRHQLTPVASTALFPNRGAGVARQSSNLGQNLTDEIYRQTGIRMNPHLFRHFAAYLYLKERPGDFETVRRMLHHKKLETTMTFYAELSNKWAHEHYDDVVLKKWGGSDGK